MKWSTALAEHGLVPDSLIRKAIRERLSRALVLAQERRSSGDEAAFRQSTAQGPIAVDTAAANIQHYELPPEFFGLVLGPYRKYSCCLYETGEESLEEAEAAMLDETCRRAGIKDGMTVLDLGCGWGAFSLWVAERYPRCRVIAVSNSRPQREYIVRTACDRGLVNLEAITADINTFRPDQRFDRIVSVEMLEHVRNHRILFSRIAQWLEPEGKLFVHIFCHDQYAYPYTTEGDENWMGRYFFTGGMMPSRDLLPGYSEHLALEQEWKVNGRHYARTCNDWLKRMDAEVDRVTPILMSVYGPEAPVWKGRWRMFFMACAELFNYRNGQEWFVNHYLFAPVASAK